MLYEQVAKNIQFGFQTESMEFCETDARFLKQGCLKLFSKPGTSQNNIEDEPKQQDAQFCDIMGTLLSCQIVTMTPKHWSWAISQISIAHF